MYTLTIDDEMIQALREGQSLMSTIPASIRGKVDRIRIEYKPNPAAPISQPKSPDVNSILNRGTSSGTGAKPFDDTPFGQATPNNPSAPPPLLAPNTTTGLERSSSPPLAGGSQQNDSGFDWNPSRAPVSRSTSSLTPIDEPRNGWLIGNRSDSNAIFGAGDDRRIQTSPPAPIQQPLSRTSLDPAAPWEDGIFTGPPAVSRSLPTLDAGKGSSGITASPPATGLLAADNMPTVGADQVLSKPPAESSQGQVLGANDAATERSQDRTQVYLFMLLLCSLGLNVYLAWISRGFYVRYQELASELRDTFTPSNAA
jgi:hypothetical protein